MSVATGTLDQILKNTLLPEDVVKNVRDLARIIPADSRVWNNVLLALINNQDAFIQTPHFIRGTQESDVIHGDLESQVIDALFGNDTIYAGDGGDYILAGDGNDRLDGQTNDAKIIGNTHDKQVIGIADYLSGGNGDDTFVVDFGFGPLNVQNIEGYQTLNSDIVSNGVFILTDFGFGSDTLEIVGNNFSDLIFTDDVTLRSNFNNQGQVHNGVLITNTTTKTSALVHGADLDDLPAIFDDYVVKIGNVSDDIISNEGGIKPALFYGGEGDDILEGHENFGDYLIAGGGDDVLRPMGNNATAVTLNDEVIEVSSNPDVLLGGVGNDIFVLDALEGGVIFIDDYNPIADSIRVKNINFDDIGFEYDIEVKDDFRVRQATKIDLGSTQLFVQGDFSEDIPINIIAFADDDENDPLIIRPIGQDIDVPLTDMSDQYFGTFHNETITAMEGDDRVRGGVGSDVIYGGDGNDAIAGGIGIDHIMGEGGDDTLYFDVGDGNTTSSSPYAITTLVVNSGEKPIYDTITGGEGEDNFTLVYEGDFSDAQIAQRHKNLSVITDFNSEEDYLRIENATEDEVDITGIKIIDRAIDGRQMAYLSYAQQEVVFKDVIATNIINRIIGLENQIGAKILLHGEATNDDLVATQLDRPYIIKGFAGNDKITGSNRGDFLFGGDGDDMLIPNANMGSIRINQADMAGIPIAGTGMTYHPDMEVNFSNKVFTLHGDYDQLSGGNGEDIFHIKYDDSGTENENDDDDVHLGQAFYITDISAVDDELIISNIDHNKAKGLPDDLVIEDMTLYDTINNTSITGSYMDFADTQIFINNVSAGLLKTIAKINDVNITATDADDLLYGSADADIIDGLAGHDTIFTLAGSDIINGGLGNDEISGGSSDSSLVINFDFIPPDLRETTKQEAFDDDGNPINIVDEYLVNGTADILYGDDGDDSFIMNLNDDFGVQIVKDYQENEVVKIIKDSATIMRVLTTMIDGVNSTLIHDGEMDSAIIIPDYEKEQVRIITSIGG